ncbi:MAG: hypothetical protein NVV74_25595 [Magnetospirillum sp.]|nr:hypothetical protein [Magnetospirillum sp.]
MTTEVIYTADGITFVFPFAIETEDDCQVLIDGTLQRGGYSLRGQASIDGGAVIFAVSRPRA